MSTLVIDLDILSKNEAEHVAAQIRQLEPQWLKRGAGFATLGVAAYLDVMHADDAPRDYYGRIPACNQILEAHFGWLLERVRQALEKHFGYPALIDQRLALPGFHIFYGPGITLVDRDSQHFDLQFRSVCFPFDVDEAPALSFTLAIELPAAGGGLDYWAFTEEDLARLHRLGRNPSMGVIGRTKPFVRHPYEPGRMAVQTAPVMHRIAAISSQSEGDCRITFQGHAIGNGEAMVLYW